MSMVDQIQKIVDMAVQRAKVETQLSHGREQNIRQKNEEIARLLSFITDLKSGLAWSEREKLKASVSALEQQVKARTDEIGRVRENAGIAERKLEARIGQLETKVRNRDIRLKRLERTIQALEEENNLNVILNLERTQFSFSPNLKEEVEKLRKELAQFEELKPISSQTIYEDSGSRSDVTFFGHVSLRDQIYKKVSK